jgi:zinc protease
LKSLSLLLAFAFILAAPALAQMRVVTLPGKSHIVDFRIVFEAGSAADPLAKPGTAYLTAMMLGQGGTKQMTYQQAPDARFPLAAGLNVQVDKEMVTFSSSVHTDDLEEYYQLLRSQLLDPGWRAEDFERVKKNAINFLRVNLRSDNDEELANEVLEENIFQGTPYGHYSAGTVASLEAITLDDLKQFYRSNYCQENLILGIAGGYTPEFLERMKQDFRRLPEGRGFRPREEPAPLIQHNRAVIVEKNSRSVAISIGFPSLGSRANPDYPALLLVSSYLGQHRSSNGILYREMREKRGLNDGDSAYIEYFRRSVLQFEPDPNRARRFQTFQLRIRPVAPDNAVFALRLALYELDKLYTEGISQEDFERTRNSLNKYLNLLTRSKSADLGDAIDGIYYLIPNYNKYLKERLATLTRKEVNRVIKRYLRNDRLVIVAVANHAEELKRALTSGEPSPITYNPPKPAETLEEDKIVEKFPLDLRPEDVRIVPVEEVFERCGS